MSVIVKEKDINYKQSSHYRANPVAQHGYIPSNALKNRKQPQFRSQIPQGVQYFDSSAKRHYTKIAIRSTISQEQLLSNPQRYPLENSLANDINYLRNLSTIDIEGANANSKRSIGVKYRVRAQEDLMRRNAKIIAPILYNGPSEEQKRRRIAQEQVSRMKSKQSSLKQGQRAYNSEKKLPPAADFYDQNHYTQRKDQAVQYDFDEQLQKAFRDRKKKFFDEQMSDSNDLDLIPKTIDSNVKFQYHFDRSDIVSNRSSSKLILFPQTVNPQLKMVFQKEKNSIQKDYIKKQFRSKHRNLNPINFAYEGAIVRNSGILASLGKNLANG